MTTRKIIYADEGKILTNGKEYGKIVYLAVGETADNWHEIYLAEYEKQLQEEQQEVSEVKEV